jgi:DNA-directed RNA polymerase specialized sigma24 family protein
MDTSLRATAVERSDCAIEHAYAVIRRTCRSLRLSPTDADDVSQDVFLWLLRNRNLIDRIAEPWLANVTGYFVKRRRRAHAQRVLREAEAASSACRDSTGEDWATLETSLALDRAERLLPDLERRVLTQVRAGVSFAAAVANLGIPTGSADWVRKRLIAHLAASFGCRKESIPRSRVRSVHRMG